jgi:UPF0755 protein
MRKPALAAAAFLAGGIAFLVALWSPVSPTDPRPVTFYVVPGETLSEIAEDLHRLGLVRHPDAFALLARVRRQSRSIQAGPYRASSGEWAWQILGRLISGDMRDTTVTVREGLWIGEVSDVVGPFVAGGPDSFRSVVEDSGFCASVGVPLPRAEGFLFPSTYRVLPGGPPELVARRMVDEFWSVWAEGLAARADSLEMTVAEVVTLASIVEAEARVAEERARIAAVYLNRLAADRPLQADPTVLYGMGERKTRTLYDDLEHPSPYNTYLHAGLPPGPIGNPGRAALVAVLWPEPGCRDLYFVARGDGTHRFARTYPEHQENRRLVREEQRARQEAAP